MPPAVRRAVLARDQHRCRVPGCTHVTFLDIHHVVPRSEGGSNDFAGLRHLGFRERDVRAVLAELLADDELRDATAERLLREALCRIRPTR
jgi:hypothetical protein